MPIVVAQLPTLCALSAVQQHQTLAQNNNSTQSRDGDVAWISALDFWDFDFFEACDSSTSVT